MRQDRRLNGWVFISSILQSMVGICLIAAGVAMVMGGFFYLDNLLKLKDLNIFLSQEFCTQFNLKPKYLYVFSGSVVGAIGLITLIMGIIALVFSKKRKVVRHRVVLTFFSLILLAIASCVALYVVYEWKVITDNIKYVAYGLFGAFAGMGLFNLLGVMFGRSEKFMSNDNGKYAFKNGSLRNARADANNNVRSAQNQHPAQVNQGTRVTRSQPMAQRPVARGQNPNMPRPTNVVNGNRPVGQNPSARMAPRPNTMQCPSVAPNGQVHSVGVRPAPSRVGTAQQRPAMPTQPRARYCPRCGKQLAVNEHVCTLCGWKPTR